MNKISLFRNLGLSAIIAAATAMSLGLSNTANAADSQDHNSSRSNKSGLADNGGGGGTDRESSAPSVSEISVTMEEITTLLASIEENLGQASELQLQLRALRTGLSEARAASSEGNEEMLSQVQDARKAFDEHVASLLSPEVVEAVSLNFTKIEFKYSATSDDSADSDDDGLGDSLDEMEAATSSALSALDSAKTATSEMIATYDLAVGKK